MACLFLLMVELSSDPIQSIHPTVATAQANRNASQKFRGLATLCGASSCVEVDYTPEL